MSRWVDGSSGRKANSAVLGITVVDCKQKLQRKVVNRFQDRIYVEGKSKRCEEMMLTKIVNKKS